MKTQQKTICSRVAVQLLRASQLYGTESVQIQGKGKCTILHETNVTERRERTRVSAEC